MTVSPTGLTPPASVFHRPLIDDPIDPMAPPTPEPTLTPEPTTKPSLIKRIGNWAKGAFSTLKHGASSLFNRVAHRAHPDDSAARLFRELPFVGMEDVEQPGAAPAAGATGQQSAHRRPLFERICLWAKQFFATIKQKFTALFQPIIHGVQRVCSAVKAFFQDLNYTGLDEHTQYGHYNRAPQFEIHPGVGTVIKEPGQGNCLFHSLAEGIRIRSQSANASRKLRSMHAGLLDGTQLRAEVCGYIRNFLQQNPALRQRACIPLEDEELGLPDASRDTTVPAWKNELVHQLRSAKQSFNADVELTCADEMEESHQMLTEELDRIVSNHELNETERTAAEDAAYETHQARNRDAEREARRRRCASIEDYVSVIEREGISCGPTEVFVASLIYGVPIHTFRRDANGAILPRNDALDVPANPMNSRVTPINILFGTMHYDLLVTADDQQGNEYLRDRFARTPQERIVTFQ